MTEDKTDNEVPGAQVCHPVAWRSKVHITSCSPVTFLLHRLP